MTNIKYNTRTFYVPAEKLEILTKFQKQMQRKWT